MIDTHAHILSEYYDIQSIVDQVKEKGVINVINAATCYKEALEVIELSKKFNNFLLPAIGIHPENINDEINLKKIEELLKENKIYAIGEIGLDYHWDKDNKNQQIELFNKQIDLAIKYKLPIIVHIRDSIQDTFNVLKSKKVKGVIHCFSGSLEMAREFIKLGFKLGIGGVITFKNSKLKDVIKEIDLKNIVLETDSPYLTPEPYRGKQNNPSNVYYVASFIAKIKNISIDEVISITTQNAKEIFDI